MNKARKKARRLVLQAMYAWILTAPPFEVLESDFLAYNKDFDVTYFKRLLENSIQGFASFKQILGPFLDREFEALDLVEQSILIMGTAELASHLDIPYRVAIDEAVGLAKMFGATESHNYVNGVLDKIAQEFRKNECASRR